MASFPSVSPSYSLSAIPAFNTYTISYGNKVEQRVALNSTVRLTFKLTWNVLSATDKGTIYDFFIARKASFESFTWTNPVDSVTYTVRFKEDMANFEYFNYLLWRLKTVEFIEVSA